MIVGTELWFAAKGRRKHILSLALAIIAAGLFFSLSRGAWLGAVIGIFVLIALRRQFRLLFAWRLFLCRWLWYAGHIFLIPRVNTQLASVTKISTFRCDTGL